MWLVTTIGRNDPDGETEKKIDDFVYINVGSLGLSKKINKKWYFF